MPRQQLQANGTPYNTLLSALRKTDLLRLCTEFHLPVNGPVATLKNRLKDYLNLHSATLYRNPRYNALFPRHRRSNLRKRGQEPSPSPPPSSHTFRTLSPTPSFGSWDGIGEPDPHNDAPEHVLPPVPPHHEPHHHDHHTPPPSDFSSRQDSFSPAVHPADGREFILHPQFSNTMKFILLFSIYGLHRTLCSPFLVIPDTTTLCSDTMQSLACGV